MKKFDEYKQLSIRFFVMNLSWDLTKVLTFSNAYILWELLRIK